MVQALFSSQSFVDQPSDLQFFGSGYGVALHVRKISPQAGLLLVPAATCVLRHIVSRTASVRVDSKENAVSKEAEIDSLVQCIDLQIQMVETILKLLDVMTTE